MKITRVVLLALLGLMVLAGFVWLFRSRNRPAGKADQLSVVASFYPLAFFAQEIGGEWMSVVNLIPAGAEPHDFEPSTRDLSLLENSRLLIINGVGFEPWAERLRDQLVRSEVKVLAVAEGLSDLQVEEADDDRADPHVWLDPVLAQEEVKRISQALTEIDPAHSQEYEKNTTILLGQLAELDQAFRSGTQYCRQKNMVTSHAAFGHLAARYGLKQVPLTGLSPEEEPTPQDLIKIAKFSKENQVNYIFLETLVSPRLAETIAREVGAQTLILDPLEGLTQEQQLAGENYFTVQRANLESLRTALDCQ